ncbi:hypothetical protein FA15DRAFT_657452 [Coprinopsis marcescibilis]|uniref:Uncharacterized protein n=1 Tax=Coprinopsis marcescibilis TaxID=230819 RepID=A0A5C3KQM4_COPMA|nr:hypothetical protein FA15DRAFT_657452 [Coprinopsis marcescibilis]
MPISGRRWSTERGKGTAKSKQVRASKPEVHASAHNDTQRCELEAIAQLEKEDDAERGISSDKRMSISYISGSSRGVRRSSFLNGGGIHGPVPVSSAECSGAQLEKAIGDLPATQMAPQLCHTNSQGSCAVGVPVYYAAVPLCDEDAAEILLSMIQERRKAHGHEPSDACTITVAAGVPEHKVTTQTFRSTMHSFTQKH